MTSEEIIKKYRLGPDSRIKFKDDPQQYWIKNISPNRKEVFIHINGAQTYRKLIKNIVQVGNEKLEKNKDLKNIIKEVIHSKTCHCGCGGSCKTSIKEEKSSTTKSASKKESQTKTRTRPLNESLGDESEIIKSIIASTIDSNLVGLQKIKLNRSVDEAMPILKRAAEDIILQLETNKFKIGKVNEI